MFPTLSDFLSTFAQSHTEVYLSFYLNPQKMSTKISQSGNDISYIHFSEYNKIFVQADNNTPVNDYDQLELSTDQEQDGIGCYT